MSSKFSNKTLGIIFAILVIAVFLIFVVNGNKNERSFREELVSIDTTNVTEILIYPKSNKHKELRLYKEGPDWKVKVNDKKIDKVPPEKITNIFRELIAIKPKRLAARGEDKWSEFQVDSTGTRIKIVEDGDETLDIILGRFSFQQPRSMSTFVRLTSDTDVYEVDGFLESQFNQNVNSFRNGFVINSDSKKWNMVTYKYPADSSFQLVKLSGKWFVNDTETDSVKTANFLRTLSKVRNGGYLDSLDTSMLSNPSHVLTIETEDKNTITVEGYNMGDKLIIHSSMNPDNYFDGKNSKLWEKIFAGVSKVMSGK